MDFNLVEEKMNKSVDYLNAELANIELGMVKMPEETVIGYLNRSRYYFDVYVANVEGTDLYVQGPSNLSDISSWKVKVNGNDQAVVLDTDLAISAPSAVTAKFTAVKNDNNQLSYYQMTIGEQEYYWNSTYHCWKRISK